PKRSARAFAGASAMSMNVTRLPCAANAATNAAPMPDAPPETKTPRPARSGYRARSSIRLAKPFSPMELYMISMSRPWESPAPRAPSEQIMDMPVNSFKRAIASGSISYGAWLVSGAPATAEALGSAGFDFLVVDTEHTPIDPPQVSDILRAIAGTPASAIVRPPWNDMVMVKRLLDIGAQSLLIPFVQNADEARRAVAHTRYPPDGVRGVAAVHRGSRYGNVANYVKTAANEICVIVQIETLAATEQIAAIAAVPGV